MAQEDQDLQSKRLPSGVSIWPPTQRTRDAVVRRLVDTLTTPSSVLAQRFGTVSSSEAESVAQLIEQESLAAVSAKGMNDSVEEGIEALQLYSKEISESLLKFSKSRAGKEDSREGATNVKGDEEEERSVEADAPGEGSV